MKRFRVLSLALLCLLNVAAGAADMPPPPLEAFARLPAMTQLKLSPNGERFAGLLNQDERTVLVVREVMGRRLKAVLVTDNKLFTFNWLRWANDGRLVVSLRYASRRDSVETVETRLLSLDPDGGAPVNLVKTNTFSRNRPQQFQDQVVDWMPEDGQHLLLALRDSEQAIEPSVYEVEIATGKRRMVQQAQADVLDWTTDAQHRVRVGLAMTRDGQYSVKARAPDGKDWRTLWSFRLHEDEVWPLGFGLDPQLLYVRATHQGRAAVFSVRLDQPDLPRALLLSDAEHDVHGELLHSPASGEVLGLRTASQQGESGEPRSELWSPQWKAQAKAIDLALPQRFNRLTDIARDEQRYLVYSSGNGQPGEYYIGDRRTGDLSLLVETYPELGAAQLAPKRREQITARDGLPLNAFLTLPIGYRRGQTEAPLPLVLLPHGGPASRDGVDFDSWSAFLASRRYAVLQVNFRGSDAYGREFKKAGLQRWGLEMQDDLSDAVAWAVRERIADPKRVCIVGGSYGGYAALMGLVKTPELYRCGVSFAGVTDLQDLIRYEADYYGGRAAAEQQIGRYWGDRERLKATSPALQVARIQAPVLLVHGAMDRVVPVDQSRDMAKALKGAGKAFRYVEQPDGDHSLSRNANRIEFFRELEAFLAESLGEPAR